MDGLHSFKINPAKSEFLWCPTAYHLHHVNNSAFCFADGDVVSMTYVRIFGAFFVPSMTMETHINRLVSTCFYRMQAISQSIPTSAAVQLFNTFVISDIDCCNSRTASISVGSYAVNLCCPTNLWESQIQLFYTHSVRQIALATHPTEYPVHVLPAGEQGSSWISAWIHDQVLYTSPAV